MATVGIVGLGFIGKMHLATLRREGLADVAAVADKVSANLAGQNDTSGNLSIDSDYVSLQGVETYPDGNELLKHSDAEVVLVALPTYLHRDFVLDALDAGKHVICEKPMARTSAEGAAMIEAAEKSDRMLFFAHCIRFWPAYEKAEEFIKDSTYGRVVRAHFWRMTPKPTWSWNNWLMDEAKSGGCILDLHIHDVDYVSQVFGNPSSIQAAGFRHGTEGIGDVMATYTYDDGKLVTIAGGWEQQNTFPFRMGFRIVFEHATLEFNSLMANQLHIYPSDDEALALDMPAEDGYTREHRYFFDCIQTGRKPARVTPRSSLDALELIERELHSIG